MARVGRENSLINGRLVGSGKGSYTAYNMTMYTCFVILKTDRGRYRNNFQSDSQEDRDAAFETMKTFEYVDLTDVREWIKI